MSDNEIIKALERMAFIESRKGEVQKEKVLESAAEIIKSQKAEIEALKLINSTYVATTNEIREIAIKEFAERLRQCSYQSADWSRGGHPMVVEWDDIDDVLEEMVGERDDKR